MMKKLLIAIVALSTGLIQCAAAGFVPFELWNKTSKPLYFAVASTKSATDNKVISEPMTELPAGKYVTATNSIVKLDQYTRLAITQDPKSQTVTVYTFNPGKHIWVRAKGGNGNLVFGPQTGPWLGFAGTLERGLPKDENVTSSDYQQQSITRSKFQQLKKFGKGLAYGYTIGG